MDMQSLLASFRRQMHRGTDNLQHKTHLKDILSDIVPDISERAH